MAVLVVQAVLPVEPGTRGDIDLAADDGLDARLAAGLVEGDGAVHDAVVGDGQGRLSQLLGALRQPVRPAGAVEQAVLGMHM